MGLQEQERCMDPKYQREKGVNTAYPQGTVCFTEPASGKLDILVTVKLSGWLVLSVLVHLWTNMWCLFTFLGDNDD